MSTYILPVDHFQQREEGDCLAACAIMALHYIGVTHSYRRLRHLLKIKRGLGTPFYNVQELTRLHVKVDLQIRFSPTATLFTALSARRRQGAKFYLAIGRNAFESLLFGWGRI